MAGALVEIEKELEAQLAKFKAEGKILEAQRLNARVRFDLEMMQEVGHCPASRIIRDRFPGKSLEPLPIRCTIFFQKIFFCWSTNRTSPSRKYEPCMLGTAVARRRW